MNSFDSQTPAAGARFKLVSPYSSKVHDGLLDVHTGEDSPRLAHILSRAIIRWVADMTAESMDRIYRCSRMCHAMLSTGQMLDLTREDVAILKTLTIDETWALQKTLLAVHSADLASGMSPSDCHAAAMSVVSTMSG